jgi:23S rRNA pseudoU1915 N3-methylase RlmH
MNQLQQKLSFEEEIQKLIERVDSTASSGTKLKEEILNIFVDVAEILLMFCNHNMVKMKPLRKKKSTKQKQKQQQDKQTMRIKKQIQQDGFINSFNSSTNNGQVIKEVNTKDLSDLFQNVMKTGGLDNTVSLADIMKGI